MERSFDFDFSNVRVHSDATAADLSKEVGANAVTVGSDLFFAPGQFEPESPDGEHLLAHELAHVVQNAQGAVTTLPFLSNPETQAEVEATSAADAFVTGDAVSITSAPMAVAAREGDGSEEHRHKGGWMDHLFGLNPEKSFVESGMEGLGYGQDGIWGRPPKEGEGQGTTLLRGLGAAATSPLAAFAAVGGHALDEINHGPSLFHGAFDW